MSELEQMDVLPSVIQAHHDGGFRIRLTFNDHLQGTVDLESWLEGPIFEPLKDQDYFQLGLTSRPKRRMRL